MKATGDGLIAYVGATSGNDPSIYNCSVVGGASGRITITVPMALDLQRISVVGRSTDNNGDTIVMNAVPTVVGNTTVFEIYMRDNAGVLGGGDITEFSVYRLPL